MTIIRWAALLALLICAPVASAQTTASSVQAPAGWAPMEAPCVKQVDGTCVPVSTAAPLPVTSTAGTGASASQVQGTAAAASADVGNPIKVGCVYSSTLPTLTDGQRSNCQSGTRGALSVQIVTVDGTVGANIAGASSDALTGATAGLASRSLGYIFNGTNWDRARGDTTGAYVISKGVGTLATGQVSVGTSSTLVAAARAGRSKISMSVGAANTCAFGNTGVTTSTGYPLQPAAGASLVLETSAAIYAACSATTTISFIEQY